MRKKQWKSPEIFWTTTKVNRKQQKIWKFFCTFKNRMTDPRLKSSKNPQILTTISVMVGSQTPLLQNPVLHGVPSGSISSGCITKQEVLRFWKENSQHWLMTFERRKRLTILQHLLQESGVVSHMQVCKSWVSQKGIHLPPRHSPRSIHFVPSAIGREAGQVAALPLHVAS